MDPDGQDDLGYTMLLRYRQKSSHDRLQTYHILSPCQHAVGWQLRSVDGRSLEPCWQA